MSSTQWYICESDSLGKLNISSSSYSSSGLPITAITVSVNDTLWAILHNFLLRYDAEGWKIITSIKDVLVYGQPIDRLQWWDNTLWLSGMGLWYYSEGEVRSVQGTPRDLVVSLTISPDEKLTVGFQSLGIWQTENGLDWYVLHSFENEYLRALAFNDSQCLAVTQSLTVTSAHQKNIKKIPTIYSDRNWTNAQMYIQLGANNKWSTYSFIPKAVRAVTILSDGNALYIGTEGDGIWLYDNGKWTNTRSANLGKKNSGPSTNEVFALHKDNTSRIWSVHLYGDSFGVFEQNKWYAVYPAVQNQEGIFLIWHLGSTTASYYQSEEQVLWFGTAVGEIGWMKLTHSHALSGNGIFKHYKPNIILFP